MHASSSIEGRDVVSYAHAYTTPSAHGESAGPTYSTIQYTVRVHTSTYEPSEYGACGSIRVREGGPPKRGRLRAHDRELGSLWSWKARQSLGSL